MRRLTACHPPEDKVLWCPEFDGLLQDMVTSLNRWKRDRLSRRRRDGVNLLGRLVRACPGSRWIKLTSPLGHRIASVTHGLGRNQCAADGWDVHSLQEVGEIARAVGVTLSSAISTPGSSGCRRMRDRLSEGAGSASRHHESDAAA